MAILYQDDDWLCVDKPTGMSTHAPRPGELGLVEWLQLHLHLASHVVSRLDRGTSGVVMLARTAAASARAQEIHESGAARKVYLFYSHVDSRGPGRPDRWTCRDELDGRPAETTFRRLASSRDGAPVAYEAEIARGRHHQIRRHAAAAGIPLLGDQKYGGRPWGRLCLHCRAVHWPDLPGPVEAPEPPAFEILRRANRNPLERDFAVARDRRGALLPLVTDAWRVVHRDEIDGLPAAVDVYGPWFDATWFEEERRADEAVAALEPLLDLVGAAFGCRGGVVRVHRRDPHHRALVAGTVTVGEPPPAHDLAREHGLRLRIGLPDAQHSGLFLDQRDARRRLSREAAGARLANLFAYTCSFSVAAVAAEAEVAFSVDVAKPALTRGRENFQLNGLTEGGRGKFIQQDARDWLRRQLRRQAERPEEFTPLDLVVCDPPVFATGGKGRPFSLEREWPFLAEAAASLLKRGGQAVFANNHRAGDDRFYRGELVRRFAEVVDLCPPLDFPELPGAPPHVRSFWCRK